jgi:hypothetical protein
VLIPAQRPDAIEPPALRREAMPVSAPLPISGLPEQAQRADPRLAVQTVLPGFEGQAAIAPRRAPGLAQTPEQPEVAGARPERSTQPAPSSLLQLSPRGEAITQWLALATARRPLNVPVSWPEPDAQSLNQAQTLAQTQAPAGPTRTLWALYLALARSDLFAPAHLFREFWPQVHAKPGQQAGDDPKVQRWLQALSPQAEPALDAASLMLGGTLAWQGELLAGWPATLQRADVWRRRESSQELEKGVALQLELQVPDRGPLRVHAHQWGSEIDIRVSWPPQTDWLAEHWDALQARLATMGLPGLRLSRQAWQAGEPAPASERGGA